MEQLEVLAVAPAGRFDPNLAIAASRAGATGLLNLDGTVALAEIRQAVLHMSRFCQASFGFRVDPDQVSSLEGLIAVAGPSLQIVVLAGPHARDELSKTIANLRNRQLRVILEAVDGDEISLAISQNVDGLIVKGNESGGRVGKESTFVLLQRYRKIVEQLSHPPAGIFVQGGVGVATAAACVVGGATGVVLDAQLLLARESNFDDAMRSRIAAFDGSETLCLGEETGPAIRLWTDAAQSGIAKELAAEDDRIRSTVAEPQRTAEWRDVLHRVLTPALSSQNPVHPSLLLVGQDIAFAKSLANRFVTVGGIVQAIRKAATDNVRKAQAQKVLAVDGPLARSHKTKYPILQGPMTRVSDTAAFAESVATAGGLPFLALALLRRNEVEPLVAETQKLLGDRSWGVGILGFVPPDIRKEQIDCVLVARPPFAIIAGGRPDQAKELESAGIATYLHVPAPGLLKMFLKDGATRFIFEGRECGGHVGPRSSFVLWETMVETILEYLGPNRRGENLHAVFAGGIHDAASTAMVAAISAPLAERGVKVGVLLGTAYLFTHEAVAGGAIVPRFQAEAIDCDRTVLLQTSPGHAIRCIDSPYFDAFETERRRLKAEGKTHEEIVRQLEWMNLGRLRLASKGVERSTEGATAKLVEVDEKRQFDRGMYMIGQLAGLRDKIVSMAELHADIGVAGAEFLQQVAVKTPVELRTAEKPCDIAIIGMSCFYPKALDVKTYWSNLIERQNAVIEVPASHWDWRLYYDADPRKPDKIISKWGGFLDDMPFDPMAYGITPASMPAIEPLQLYLLEGVKQALDDAGYAKRPFDRTKTCAILGIGGGGSPLGVSYGFRTCIPLLETVPGLDLDIREVEAATNKLLPTWSEDSFPGILMNVAVGRVANRFDFGGTNYAIDAACASSLAAVQACVRELEAGTSDMAVAMGADSVQTPYAYMCFSKTHALSPTGKCRPFDSSADGIVLSEGIGIVILKRLADAERDGDRIYSVIKGMGASSDGKAKGLTAPRREGQALALQRAYDKAGVSPASIELVEAHGTGTVVGDQTEAQTMSEFFSAAGAAPQSCAIGSVKSMIGHSKCAAGIAGLIKTAFAVRTKTLPPTLVESRNEKGDFEHGPLFLNTRARPWIHADDSHRRAGVSAFGFGGTNFHAVLEEYRGDFGGDQDSAYRRWPSELILLRRGDRKTLLAVTERLRSQLAGNLKIELATIARAASTSNDNDASHPTLAIVATDLADLREKLNVAAAFLKTDGQQLEDPRGVLFAEKPAERTGKVAFLFPGQGSQYPDMLADLALAFGEVREIFERADQALSMVYDRPLSRFIFPPSAFGEDEDRAARLALTRTEVAQPAIGAASLAMFGLLGDLGLKPDFVAGHSYGEYVALAAAKALTVDDLFKLSYRRGKVLVEAADSKPGAMAALETDGKAAEAIVAGIDGVVVANINGPKQTVISGFEPAIDAALARCQTAGIRGHKIAVACGFHSPHVANAVEPWAATLAEVHWSKPTLPVYSNLTATVHADDSASIRNALTEHVTHPVRFVEEIEALYDAGARLFVEVGPAAVLTGLVKQTLGERPHLAVASDVKNRHGLTQLCYLLAQLAVHGVSTDLSRLFQHRDVPNVELDDLAHFGTVVHPKGTWLINSVRSRPIDAPEPLLIGQQRQPRKAAAKTTSTAQPIARKPLEAPQANSASPTAHAERNGTTHSLPLSVGTPPSASEAGRVMMQFQDLMAKFLDTQKSVMQQYLAGAPAVAPAQRVAHPVAIPLASTNGHANHKPLNLESTPVDSVPKPVVKEAHVSPKLEVATVAAKPKIDRPWLEAQLLELISKRTGYPKDMVGPDLDLEADLGIDSIKRVEILGTLAEMLGEGDSGPPQDMAMEKLTTIKSLRGILDYLEPIFSKTETNGVGEPHAAKHAGHSENGVKVEPSKNGSAREPEGGHKKQLDIQRALVRLVDVPLPHAEAPMLPAGAIVVVDDGQGVSKAVASKLADFGQEVIVVRHVDESNAGVKSDFAVDLCDPKAISELIERIRRDFGSIAGLIHLLPLANCEASASYDRARRDSVSLYLLAKSLESDLRNAGKNGSAICWTVTGLGGGLGFETQHEGTTFAGEGGPIGFLKCIAFEWPEVVVRAIDVDPALDAELLAESILGELTDRDGPLEVGRLGHRRVSWEPFAAPVDRSHKPKIELNEKSNVLITGGARGITATVALELATRFKCNLVLLGRSAEPEEEPEETRNLSEPAAIKAALMKSFERERTMVAPAAVESAYRRLIVDREIRGNLRRLRKSGASIHYYAIDVRDDSAFGSLLDEVTKRFGAIDVAIHGAGVIEDKLLRDKTLESFDRVFETKVRSALLLASKLDPTKLKAFVLFSSIASRYGNKGQGDYAAANETLSKLALDLDRRWPARVASIAWGPWAEVGMVADLQKHLVQRGLKLISPTEGPKFVVDEILFGSKGEAEAIVAGGADHMARPARPKIVATV